MTLERDDSFEWCFPPWMRRYIALGIPQDLLPKDRLSWVIAEVKKSPPKVDGYRVSMISAMPLFPGEDRTKARVQVDFEKEQ